MTGTQETFHNSDDFGFGDGVVHPTTDRIVTDDGWWDQSFWGYTNPETGTTHFVNQLTGHGAYEGLSAVDFATRDLWGGTIELDGVIFPGELSAYPEKLEPIE